MKKINYFIPVVLFIIGGLIGCNRSYPKALLQNQKLQQPLQQPEAWWPTIQVVVYTGISNYPSNTIVNGPITTAEYAYPQGMALDASGNLYVADWLGGDIRKITPGSGTR